MSTKRGRPGRVCFQLLRDRMLAHGISADRIGERIHRDRSVVYKRLRGETEWTQSEMYAVMELLDVPETELYLYFPRNCVSSEKAQEKTIRHYLRETNQVLVPASALDGLVALANSMNTCAYPHGR